MLSFFFTVNKIHCVYVACFLYPIICRQTSRLVLFVGSTCIINMGVQVCLWYVYLESIKHIPKTGMAWSNGGSIFSFLSTPAMYKEV